MSNFQEKSNFIWNLADLLRGSYKRNEYQKVILPFTVLKRFDSVLEYSKQNVLDNYNKYKDQIDNIEPILLKEAVDEEGNNLGFYNFSKYDFKTLLQDPENIEENILFYLDCAASCMFRRWYQVFIRRVFRRVKLEDYHRSCQTGC